MLRDLQVEPQAAEGLSPYRISDDLAERGVKLSHVTVRKISCRVIMRRIASVDSTPSNTTRFSSGQVTASIYLTMGRR